MPNPDRLYLNPVHTLEPQMTMVQVPHLNFHNEICWIREPKPTSILTTNIQDPSNFFSYTKISPKLLLAWLKYVRRQKNFRVPFH